MLFHASKPASAPPLSVVAKIAIQPDGRFAFDGDTDAIVVSARDRHGHIVDAVAFTPEDKCRWYMREGTMSILGAQEVAGAEVGGGPLPLHPTPSAWLQADGIGAVVLDWDAPLAEIFHCDIDLSHLSTPVAKAMARRLRANFNKSLPRISMPKESRHAAA